MEKRRVKRKQKWASTHTLLHFYFAKGFIKKSFSRAWWNLFYVRVCAHGLQCVFGHRHICVLVRKIICVLGERDLLNYLHTEVSNWYQVFKWGQMSSFMLCFSCLKSVSLHLSCRAAVLLNSNLYMFLSFFLSCLDLPL